MASTVSLITTKPNTPPANETVPTRAQALLFRAKVAVHRAKRLESTRHQQPKATPALNPPTTIPLRSLP